jgi:tetratricopeptide (TPR) repeat protein
LGLSMWWRKARALRGPSLLGNASLIVLAIAGLFAADTFLAKVVRAESQVEAAHLFDEGKRFLARRDYAAAISRLENALLIERENRDYVRALAQAQLAAGNLAAAETNLTDLLQNDPTDGLASLVMARALVKEARFMDAISYFHRAIYGNWEDHAEVNRVQARFELIDLLAQRNSKEELLAELLAVQDEAPADLPTRKRIGHLFLAAGSPTRAAEVFRGIFHDRPADADAWAGMGEAEFANANYRSAQKDFLTALRFDPGDKDARERLDLADRVLMLDPSIRGLSSAERFRRSRELLALTLEETSQCTAPAPSPEWQQLSDQARKDLNERIRISRQDAASEDNLDLAEQLWQMRKTVCKAPAGSRDPLALVQARLAQ